MERRRQTAADRCRVLWSNQAERGLQQLTQGLAGLDIGQTSANHTAAMSNVVGGARPKVRLSQEEVTGEGEATPEQSQSAESTLLQPQVSRKYSQSHLSVSLCSSDSPVCLSVFI